MTRVFTTSSGVVNAAAVPPAIIPHTPASPGDGLRPDKYLRDSCDLSASYNGNWIDVNGSYMCFSPTSENEPENE